MLLSFHSFACEAVREDKKIAPNALLRSALIVPSSSVKPSGSSSSSFTQDGYKLGQTLVHMVPGAKCQRSRGRRIVQMMVIKMTGQGAAMDTEGG